MLWKYLKDHYSEIREVKLQVLGIFLKKWVSIYCVINNLKTALSIYMHIKVLLKLEISFQLDSIKISWIKFGVLVLKRATAVDKS